MSLNTYASRRLILRTCHTHGVKFAHSGYFWSSTTSSQVVFVSCHIVLHSGTSSKSETKLIHECDASLGSENFCVVLKGFRKENTVVMPQPCLRRSGCNTLEKEPNGIGTAQIRNSRAPAFTYSIIYWLSASICILVFCITWTIILFHFGWLYSICIPWIPLFVKSMLNIFAELKSSKLLRYHITVKKERRHEEWTTGPAKKNNRRSNKRD